MQNIVNNMCEKFHDGRSINDGALGTEHLITTPRKKQQEQQQEEQRSLRLGTRFWVQKMHKYIMG